MLTFSYRLYPTASQSEAMRNILNKCRFLYNCCLIERRSGFEKGIKINKRIQEKELTIIKNDDSDFTGIHTHILQDVVKRLDLAYQGFFRRVKLGQEPGYPRFKSRSRYHSFAFKDVKNNNGFKIVSGGKRVKISGIGNVKVKFHRSFTGTPVQAIIKLDTDNHWYLKLICDNIVTEKLPKTNKTIGIDIGIKTFVTGSDGLIFENIKVLKHHEDRLAKAQRALALKTKRSNNYKKQKVLVSKINNKIARIRDDYLHKVSRHIVNNYHNIAVEDLNIESIIENGSKNIIKGILDIAPGKLIHNLTYKAENAGRLLIKVDPQYTSKMCSRCQNIKYNLRLDDRIYHCDYCGLIIDRDLNASINIKEKAFNSFKDRADPLPIAQSAMARSPF